MARRIILIDDIDGSEQNVETVAFSVKGRSYEIDLSQENELRLMSVLGEFIEHARRSDLPKQSTPKHSAPADGLQSRVRVWARANGVEHPRMGRLPDALIMAYREATGE